MAPSCSFLGMFFPSFKVNGLIAFPLSAPKKPLINITKKEKKKEKKEDSIVYMIVFVCFLLHSLFQSGRNLFKRPVAFVL